MNNKKPAKKRGGGQPTKLNDAFIAAAKEVLSDEHVLCCTDEDLLFLINEKLREDGFSVSKSAFEKWKKKVNDTPINKLPSHLYEFLRILRGAIIRQKLNLFRNLKREVAQPFKWTWIIERKFGEWNMTQKQKVDATLENKSDVNIIFEEYDEEKHGKHHPFPQADKGA